MMCEKCWTDAFRKAYNNPMKTQSDYYFELVEERKNNPCSPKEQAGQFWDEEKQIDMRQEANHDR